MRKDKGIALLFAVLVSSAILVAAYAFYSAVGREVVVTSTLYGSMKAFYAKDAGTGCIGHWTARSTEFQKISGGSIKCNNNTFSVSGPGITDNWTFNIVAPDVTSRVNMEVTPNHASQSPDGNLLLSVAGNVQGYNTNQLVIARRVENTKTFDFGVPNAGCPFLTSAYGTIPFNSQVIDLVGLGHKAYVVDLDDPCIATQSCAVPTAGTYYPSNSQGALKGINLSAGVVGDVTPGTMYPKGRYWVALVSSDDHHLKISTNPTNESYELVLYNEGNANNGPWPASPTTTPISDLPQTCNQLVESVTPAGSPFWNFLPVSWSIRIHHPPPYDTGDYNDITAVCAILTPVADHPSRPAYFNQFDPPGLCQIDFSP
jgi:hypothetical protein